MTKQFRIASLADHPHAAPVLAHWASRNDLASQRIAVIVQRAQQHGPTQRYLRNALRQLVDKLGWEPMFRTETYGADVMVVERQLL